MGDKTKTYWKTGAVERARATVRVILKSKCQNMSRDEKLRHMAAQVMLLNESPSPLDQLVRLSYAFEALELHAAEGGLERRHVQQLFAIATDILERHGVLRGRSRLAFLHGELLLLMGRIEAAGGATWQALMLVKQAVAATAGGPEERAAAARLFYAERLLRQGNAAMALTLAVEAPQSSLVQAAALRALGRPAEALRVLAPVGTPSAEWEIAKIEACAPGKFADLARDMRRGGRFYFVEALLEFALYCYCHDPVRARQTVPSLASLVRRANLEWQGDRHTALLQRVRPLEEAYQADAEAEPAVVRLVHGLAELSPLPTLEQEWLVRFAAGRFFACVNAMDLATVTLRDYQAASWRASDGATLDALGVGDDLLSRPWMASKAS